MDRNEVRAGYLARVLVAEDSRTQAEIIRAILEKHGFVPFLAMNGKQALGMLDEVNPDIIISDVMMPAMDGYAFCKAVKGDPRYTHIPVILLTMLSNPKDIIYALVSGADNFITKPYQGDYLISRLKSILDRRNIPEAEDEPEEPFVITHAGETFTITHNRHHIIKLLISAYEAAVIQHEELTAAQKRLSVSHEEANLYRDIITHDINNVNSGALALTELLLMKTGEENRPLTRRLFNSINQSVEIIGNVATIRKLYEAREPLREMDLDGIIRQAIDRYPESRIHYTGTAAHVLADSLLSQVFTNIIGNSVKFSQNTAEITVEVTEQPGRVEILIADTGPGIEPDLKPILFDRFRKGTGSGSGKGLGLFIARHLVEGYGGRIWADDRVPDHPDQGAAIHVTLKKPS